MDLVENYLSDYICTNNVYLFVPNLIGYARIVSLLLSCLFMLILPTPALFFYFVSASLDAIDGFVARRYNQESRLGGMIDQLTDRCGTLCLMIALAALYPHWCFFLQLSAVIDIGSHWMHTQVSLMSGNTSHKIIEGNKKINWSDPTNFQALLHLYYSNRSILFGLCLANEVFYVSFYMLYFYKGYEVLGLIGIYRFLVILTFPFAVLKILVNLIQWYIACLKCGEMDTADRFKSK